MHVLTWAAAGGRSVSAVLLYGKTAQIGWNLTSDLIHVFVCLVSLQAPQKKPKQHTYIDLAPKAAIDWQKWTFGPEQRDIIMSVHV